MLKESLQAQQRHLEFATCFQFVCGYVADRRRVYTCSYLTANAGISITQ